MRKSGFWKVALLMASLFLYACGGGGGGGTTPPVTDVNAPVVTAFTMPATSSIQLVSILSFTATDSVGVTGYLLTVDSATEPFPNDPSWITIAPTTIMLNSGTHTVYAWAKNAAGYVSLSKSATVTVTADEPTITTFTMSPTATSTTGSITAFTASTNATGYLLTSSAATPSPAAFGWTTTAPTTYIFPTTAVTQTVYAWVKNAAGVVSASKSATVTLTLPALKITGRVIDPSTDAYINATFTVYKQSDTTNATPLATGSIVQNGTFNGPTDLIHGTAYKILFHAAGFQDVTYYNIVPSQENETVVENVRMIPASLLTQVNTVSGYIKNPDTNVGLSSMVVKLRQGIGNKTDTAAVTINGTVISDTTDTDGLYTITDLPAGVYTAEVSKTGVATTYFTLVCVPGNLSANSGQNWAIAPATSALYRFVLSWDNNPTDLDLLITGPLAPGDLTTRINFPPQPRFLVYGVQPAYPANSISTDLITSQNAPLSNNDVFLDVDKTQHGIEDNGAETITIRQQRTGTYNLYVRHSAGAGTLTGSNAQVKVYKGNTLLRILNVPTSATSGVGNVWRVCFLEGTTLTPLDANQSPNVDPFNLAKRAVTSMFDEYLLLRNLPRK